MSHQWGSLKYQLSIQSSSTTDTDGIRTIDLWINDLYSEVMTWKVGIFVLHWDALKIGHQVQFSEHDATTELMPSKYLSHLKAGSITLTWRKDLFNIQKPLLKRLILYKKLLGDWLKMLMVWFHIMIIYNDLPVYGFKYAIIMNYWKCSIICVLMILY